MADKNALTAELARKLAKARRKAKRWRGTAAAWKDRHDEVLDANAALHRELRQARLDVTLRTTERDQFGSIATTMATEVDRLREQVDTATAQVGRLAAAEARAEELEASVAELSQSYDLIQAARQRELRTWEAQRSEGQAQNERLIAAADELRQALAATASELAQMTAQRDQARRAADQQLTRTTEALDRITELEAQHLTDADLLAAHRMADDQVGRLARFIAENIPGEPSRSEGAVDCAIRLLRPTATFAQQLAKAREAEAPFITDPTRLPSTKGVVLEPTEPATPDVGLMPGEHSEPVDITNEADFTDCSGPKHCRGGSGRHHAHKWWDDHEPDAERWYCDGSATYDLAPGQCGWDVLGFACTLPEGHDVGPDATGHVSAGGTAWISAPLTDPVAEAVAELAELLPDVDEELAEYGAPGLATPLAVGTPEQIAAYAPTVETPEAPVADEVRGPVYEPLDESQHDPTRTVDASELTEAIEDEAIVDTYAPGTLRQALDPHRDAIAAVLAARRHDEGWCDDPEELADEIIDAVAPPELSPAQQLTADVDVWLAQNVANVEQVITDTMAHAKGGMSSPGQWFADLCSFLARRDGEAGHVIGPPHRDKAWELATAWALEVVEEGSRELTAELEQLHIETNLARDALTNAIGERDTCANQLDLRRHQVVALRTALFGPEHAQRS